MSSIGSPSPLTPFTGMVKWKWDIMPVVLIAGFGGLPFKTLLHL
jgi:hypothetical protein